MYSRLPQDTIRRQHPVAVTSEEKEIALVATPHLAPLSGARLRRAFARL